MEIMVQLCTQHKFAYDKYEKDKLQENYIQMRKKNPCQLILPPKWLFHSMNDFFLYQI